MRKFSLTFLALALILVLPSMQLLGQEDPFEPIAGVVQTSDQIPPLTISSSQMRSPSPSNSVIELRSELYQLADCNVDENAPCYVQRVLRSAPASDASIVALSSQTYTQQCGYYYYSVVGIPVAVLLQNVNVTYHNGYTMPPATLNWGDLGGTWAGAGLQWQDPQGPNPNPGWGVRANSYASTTAQATLVTFTGSGSIIASTRMIIDGNGTYCQ